LIGIKQGNCIELTGYGKDLGIKNVQIVIDGSQDLSKIKFTYFKIKN